MRRIFAVGLSAVLLFMMQATAQTGASHLRPGDGLPSVAGRSLTGREVTLPPIADRRRAVVIFSFSRVAGQDAKSWGQRLEKDDRELPIDTVIFLQSVPGLFRPMVVSAIKRDMPLASQDRTLLLDADEKLWRQRLAISDDRHPCVILLGSDGRIRWITCQPFSTTTYLDLRNEIPGPN